MSRDLDVVIYARSLRAQGWTLKAIGQEIGKAVSTVCQYCNPGQLAKCSSRGKEYYLRNKAQVDERNRRNYLLNRQAVLQRTTQYSRENPQVRRKCMRNYCQNHPDRVRAKLQKYRQEHPDRVRAYAAKRRAVKASVPYDGHTASDLARHREFWGDRCAYCFDTVTSSQLHWDHVVPLSAGGAHTLRNLVPTCAPCNMSKHTKPLAQWLWPEGT